MIIDTSLFYVELGNNVAIFIALMAGLVLIYGILEKGLREKKGTKK